jgi:putative transposase
MARKPRIHFTGALYHVISRGNRGQVIFPDEGDYELYRRFLREYKKRYSFFIYAYALMPNHVHLLVEVIDTPLSRLMQALQLRYTRSFNIKYRKSGHLFQGRYKAILCERDAYLLELSAYIHLNPVRAGLVNDPMDYRYTSYGVYVKGEEDELVDTGFVLAQFSDTRDSAVRGYGRFVNDRIDQGHRKEFYEVRDQRFLGEDGFVEQVSRGHGEEDPFIYDITIVEIVSAVSSVLEISPDLIYSGSRNRQGALGRAVVGYVGRRLAGHRVKAVAVHFHRDPVAITQGMQKLEVRLQKDRAFQGVVKGIEETLTRGRKKKYLFTYT